MPLRLGDGSSIGSIRLGDGSVIGEVRLGDGSVLWSSGPGPTIVDDFEDQSLSEYSGDTGGMSITTGAAQHGTYGLENTGGGYLQIGSQPGDGLNYYPSQGDAIEWYVNPASTYSIFMWGVQSLGGTTYYARPRPDNNVLELVLNGTTYSAAQTFTDNTWYQMRLEWDDGATFGGTAGDHTVYVYDMSGTELVSITQNENTYSSGGIEVSAAEAGGMIDYIRKTNT